MLFRSLVETFGRFASLSIEILDNEPTATSPFWKQGVYVKSTVANTGRAYSKRIVEIKLSEALIKQLLAW